MIVKVKKGGASDCGCKDKKMLAKGGCAPKKKKIKKNKNGGYLVVSEIPSYGGGKSIFQIQGNQLLNPDNTAVSYKNKVVNPKDRVVNYTEEIVLNPQQTEHGIIHKKPIILGGVTVNQETGVADSTLKFMPTGNPEYVMPVNKTINVEGSTDPQRNAIWDYFWKLINDAKKKK